tara:strand:+ start:276 stop:830 length:555 start_codon:yes stop_codon:yes gene_type:complete
MDQRYDKKIILLSKEEKVFDNPVFTPPVLINTEYDIPKMKKTLTFKNVKHIYKDKSEGKMTIKVYSHSYIFVHKYTDPMSQAEINNIEKGELIKAIEDEVSGLELSEFKTKESIMKFACDNGKSNGEKRLRSTILQKVLQQKQDEYYHEQLKLAGGENKKRYQRMNEMVLYPRHRITTQEISAY